MTAPNFRIKFPLPPSMNDAWTGTGIRGNFALRRSKHYNNWIELAGTFFRQQFPVGIPADKMLKGRVRVQYIVYQNDERARDVDNYSKIITDYLQGKFYENDSQIDEVHITRRIDLTAKRNFLFVFVTEIEDKRRVDMFNPA